MYFRKRTKSSLPESSLTNLTLLERPWIQSTQAPPTKTFSNKNTNASPPLRIEACKNYWRGMLSSSEITFVS